VHRPKIHQGHSTGDTIIVVDYRCDIGLKRQGSISRTSCRSRKGADSQIELGKLFLEEDSQQGRYAGSQRKPTDSDLVILKEVLQQMTCFFQHHLGGDENSLVALEIFLVVGMRHGLANNIRQNVTKGGGFSCNAPPKSVPRVRFNRSIVTITSSIAAITLSLLSFLLPLSSRYVVTEYITLCLLDPHRWISILLVSLYKSCCHRKSSSKEPTNQ
jgi:hypothetical protein